MTQKKNTVIFDLFNVLVRWRHEKAYAKVITDPQRLEFFLQNVIGSRFDYLMEHTSIEEAVIETQKKYPESNGHHEYGFGSGNVSHLRRKRAVCENKFQACVL